MKDDYILNINNLKVSIDDKQVLQGIDLDVKKGEVHAIMGPNGSGKSTLAYSLMGHPSYELDSGEIELDSESIVDLEPHEKAQKGSKLMFFYQ